MNNWRVIEGDFQTVGFMPGQRFDHIICDPPYEEEAHTAARQVMRGNKLVTDQLVFPKITEVQRRNLVELAASVCDGWLIIFCQTEGVYVWRDVIKDVGLKYRAPMIWVKPDGKPNYSGNGPGMGFEHMVAAWCGSGNSKWNGGGRHGVFNIPKGEGEKPIHQTQKPIRLMMELVSLFTNPGDHILDPFAGSGSTGVACMKLGRQFTGIELDPKNCENARRRIGAAEDQFDMFQQPAKFMQTKLEL